MYFYICGSVEELNAIIANIDAEKGYPSAEVKTETYTKVQSNGDKHCTALKEGEFSESIVDGFEKKTREYCVENGYIIESVLANG